MEIDLKNWIVKCYVAFLVRSEFWLTELISTIRGISKNKSVYLNRDIQFPGFA